MRRNFLSVSEFAERLGVSRQAVIKRIKKGDFQCGKLSEKFWVIPVRELSRWECLEKKTWKLRRVKDGKTRARAF